MSLRKEDTYVGVEHYSFDLLDAYGLIKEPCARIRLYGRRPDEEVTIRVDELEAILDQVKNSVKEHNDKVKARLAKKEAERHKRAKEFLKNYGTEYNDAAMEEEMSGYYWFNE